MQNLSSGIGWWYDAMFAGVLGMITASFLCVCAERLPRGLGIGGRSRCACGRMLRWSENIPVLGWVRAGGEAQCCGARIPVFYLLAEVFLGAAWAVAGALVAKWPGGAMSLIVGSLITVLAVGWVRLGREPGGRG